MQNNQWQQEQVQGDQGKSYQESPHANQSMNGSETPARPHHQVPGTNLNGQQPQRAPVGPPPPSHFRSSPVHFQQHPPPHPPTAYHHHHPHGHGGPGRTPYRMGPPPPSASRYYHQPYPNRGPPPPPPPSQYHMPHVQPKGPDTSSPLRRSPVHPLEVLPSPMDSMRSAGCTCKKSRCLKLYCQCFASSTTCGPTCKCQVCHNTTLHGEAIETARKTILERNPSAFDDKFRVPPSGGPWAFPHPTSSSTSTPQMQHYPSPHPSPPRHHPHPYHPAMAPGYRNHYASATPTQQQQQWSSYGGGNPNRVSPPQIMEQQQQHPMAPSPPTTMPVPATSGLMNKYGCKCRRSFCLKKYCECYQHAAHCGANCRCTNCKNFPGAGSPGEGDGAASKEGFAPTASGDYPPKEVTIVKEAMHRRVSFDHSGNPQEEQPPRASPPTNTNKDASNDRMAIMAAVAMTELLGGKSSPTNTTTSVTSNNSSTPPELKSEETKVETSPDRRRVSPSVDTPHENLPPTKKAKTSTEGTADTTACSSPPMVRTPHMQCIKPRVPQPRGYHAYGSHHTSPRPPPVGFNVIGSNHHGNTYGMHHPTMSPSSSSPAGTPPGHYHQLHHHPGARSPPSHVYMPQPGMAHSQQKPLQPTPKSSSTTTTTPRSSPPSAYEDVIRSCGLPKALSFRKICSKCGKTRGEHGELGFGNKCVYQDCGKCGAGLHMHQKAGVPMGILCTLTVEDGATPGAAGLYERKIQELASRAELQKELQKRKQDAAARAVAAGAP